MTIAALRRLLQEHHDDDAAARLNAETDRPHDPDGRALALDDPDYGLVTGAPTLDDLIRGYPGSHIQWPDPPGPDEDLQC